MAVAETPLVELGDAAQQQLGPCQRRAVAHVAGAGDVREPLRVGLSAGAVPELLGGTNERLLGHQAGSETVAYGFS